MPFISAGKYKDSEFKYITNADANSFEDQFVTYTSNQLKYNSDNDEYEVDENIDGPSDNYTFDDPNFNIYDFNANLVIRWEYLPGSTMYLVWSQNRNTSDSSGDFSLGNDTKTLFDNYPTDILMLKLSYRFGL
jgi:hypothetical protein